MLCMLERKNLTRPRKFLLDLIFGNSVKRHIFTMIKFATRVWFTNICKQQSDIDIARGLYFRETTHPHSFAKIKPSRKFPNLQYAGLSEPYSLFYLLYFYLLFYFYSFIFFKFIFVYFFILFLFYFYFLALSSLNHAIIGKN